jgi:predicted aspartyl protease/Flp pilus assembly protein TadD
MAFWSKTAGAALLLTVAVSAQTQSPADTHLKEADGHWNRLRYEDAYLSYLAARDAGDAVARVRASTGMIRVLLRMSLYADAVREGAGMVARDAHVAAAHAVHGDALWAGGLFDEAEQRYSAALALDPADPTALHGRGRALAARRQFAPAREAVRRAIAGAPAEASFHYTLASIEEDTRQFAAAAASLERYLDLLPSRTATDMATWAASQAAFLRGFGTRVPYEVPNERESYTVPFRVQDDRVLIRGKLNGTAETEFALDTGTDQTTLTPAVASRAGIRPAMTLQSAGVGNLGSGFRTLQVARVDQLEIGDLLIRNISALIKSPSLTEIPRQEGAGFSPLAIGFSMEIDYARGVLTLARRLPAAEFPVRLPLRMQRLPLVRGTINNMPVTFVIDTGGTAVSISRMASRRVDIGPQTRLVPARVYGTSGWDKTAFLLPYLDIALAPGLGTSQRSVVVLNLDAPSALLGFEIGGILGHDFLRHYVLRIDLERAEVGFRSN